MSLVVVMMIVFVAKIQITLPEVPQDQIVRHQLIEKGPDHRVYGPNWIKTNEYGAWELYLEGKPYERGLAYGILAKDLVQDQELYFVNQIEEMIPSKFFQEFLRSFVAWFNRDLDEYVPDENLLEIYGVSQNFSDEYDFIAPKFHRILQYHGAHDIGHALADMRIVGCSSFAAQNDLTEDGGLIVGRNFDFFMGDDFAKDKLMIFIKPDSGYALATYSWAGFTGVVSGMNERGLTVTLNAASSDVPTTAKMPISLLARVILQYAETTEEAIEIAKQHETFVSESLLISSAKDKKAVVIEKTPTKLDVYEPIQDLLTCTNHYQSEKLKGEQKNIDNIKYTDSEYRYERLTELVKSHEKLNPKNVSDILRNKEGLGDANIGLGNAQSINQLIAHHAIIFKPEQKEFWVSSNPFQLGAFKHYDLDVVFGDKSKDSINQDIPKDEFLTTRAYSDFEKWRVTKVELTKHNMFGKEFKMSDSDVKVFVSQNSESYHTYWLIGDYYKGEQDLEKAKEFYEIALTKSVASLAERETIENALLQLSQ